MILKKREIPWLISVDRVWDFALHNAFTDLIFHQNKWFLTFRESDKHEGGDSGAIRVLSSVDGIIWRSAAYLSLRGVDLRDPKLSVTPSGGLMLLAGGTVYSTDKRYLTSQTRVAFSDSGDNWSQLLPVLGQHEWLWRVTWYQGKAYGVSYRLEDPMDDHSGSIATLFESDDGLNYTPLARLDVDGDPSEVTLRFADTGMMVALIRRSKLSCSAWIGASFPPYDEWSWVLTEHSFAGPNFVILPSGKMWAAGRMVAKTPYGCMEKMVLARLDFDGLHPVMVLPSGGDTGYAGMVYRNNALHVSYYSSHEGKSAIYLAKIQLPYE